MSTAPPALVHRFGEFELDLTRRRLFRAGVRVPLSEAHAAILVCLVTRAGDVVSKDTLGEAGWEGEAVTDDQIKQAVSRVRKALQSRARGAVLIETVPSRGYRFAAVVERGERRESGDGTDRDLMLYRALNQGRAALNTLTRDGLARARSLFEEALRINPACAAAPIGLANACALTFEATRIDAVCDMRALTNAVRHAQLATSLAPSSGDAWSTLAFALYLQGDAAEGAAAAQKATALEPDNWQHWLRLAFVSWGENRIRAARMALQLCPGLALAYWLIATVLIARGAFDAALDVLRHGCAAQDAQSTATEGFPGVGLHLLRGLVLAAQRRLDSAVDALNRELSGMCHEQMYARQCASNAWYALGAIRRRQRRRADAEHAFAKALQVAPAHVWTRAALGRTLGPPEAGTPRALDTAFAGAVGLACAGRHAEAADAYRAAVLGASMPYAGWLLPVEPLIDPGSHADIWADVLAIVRRRAV